MKDIERIIDEANDLLREGSELQISDSEDEDISDLSMRYESWYTRASSFVESVIPERLDDFESAYKIENRNEITYETYTIKDFLMGLQISHAGNPVFDNRQAYQAKLLRQVGILKAAIDAAPSALHDVKALLRAELFDDDIEAAKELANAQHLRSAGVVCGVVLENHLKSVSERHDLSFERSNLTISVLNDRLKKEEIYDIPTWRLIQRLGDIRNLCAHDKEREPESDEVADLIRGAEKVLKEVY